MFPLLKILIFLSSLELSGMLAPCIACQILWVSHNIIGQTHQGMSGCIIFILCTEWQGSHAKYFFSSPLI